VNGSDHDTGDADSARGTGRDDGAAGQGAGEPHAGHNLHDVWNVPIVPCTDREQHFS
jgi:hypothetical protein